ncbi:MAG: M48 family metallopeptidase [Clostridioides sp.]|nr:M48 family metallopeptidase [Clostridioides sp.]
MKRIVLRVKNGLVKVSAPYHVAKSDIDKFVQINEEWIKEQLSKSTEKKAEFKEFDDDECLAKFEKLADKVFPLVADKLKTKPKLYVKNYKSRWGVCYFKRGYIILNKQLFDKEDRLIEQVILHEYVHFIVPNHSREFHKIMEKIMPDYKERRKELNK